MSFRVKGINAGGAGINQPALGINGDAGLLII